MYTKRAVCIPVRGRIHNITIPEINENQKIIKKSDKFKYIFTEPEIQYLEIISAKYLNKKLNSESMFIIFPTYKTPTSCEAENKINFEKYENSLVLDENAIGMFYIRERYIRGDMIIYDKNNEFTEMMLIENTHLFMNSAVEIKNPGRFNNINSMKKYIFDNFIAPIELIEFKIIPEIKKIEKSNELQFEKKNKIGTYVDRIFTYNLVPDIRIPYRIIYVFNPEYKLEIYKIIDEIL